MGSAGVGTVIGFLYENVPPRDTSALVTYLSKLWLATNITLCFATHTHDSSHFVRLSYHIFVSQDYYRQSAKAVTKDIKRKIIRIPQNTLDRKKR